MEFGIVVFFYLRNVCHEAFVLNLHSAAIAFGMRCPPICETVTQKICMLAGVVFFEVGTQCVSRHCQAFSAVIRMLGNRVKQRRAFVFFCRFDLELWFVLYDIDRCESTFIFLLYHEALS